MRLDLDGRVAIVTGATSNIGRAIALELIGEGALVVGIGRDEAAGAALAGEGMTFVAADLLDPASPAAIISTAEALGPVAILVNGVGGNVDQATFADSDPARWASDIDLNFGTVLRVTHAVLHGMIARKSGAVVNIGSTAGLVGDYMLPVYSAMKGAVHSFTIALAKEVGSAGVRVNAVAPYATIDSDPAAFSAGSRFRPESEFLARSALLSGEERAMRVRRTLLGRPYAAPEDIAGLVAYLVSDRAAFVTGQIWAVDGGALL